MLRQQQAEIEALKAEIVSIEKNTDYWADKANWIKNNEPVAKVTEHGIYLEYPFGLNLKIGTLLYTHPPKELTDEEKTELENALKVCEYKYFGSYPLSEKQWEAFELLEKHAKAILRKAQEK
jgi:hypothetical protein